MNPKHEVCGPERLRLSVTVVWHEAGPRTEYNGAQHIETMLRAFAREWSLPQGTEVRYLTNYPFPSRAKRRSVVHRTKIRGAIPCEHGVYRDSVNFCGTCGAL